MSKKQYETKAVKGKAHYIYIVALDIWPIQGNIIIRDGKLFEVCLEEHSDKLTTLPSLISPINGDEVIVASTDPSIMGYSVNKVSRKLINEYTKRENKEGVLHIRHVGITFRASFRKERTQLIKSAGGFSLQEVESELMKFGTDNNLSIGTIGKWISTNL